MEYKKYENGDSSDYRIPVCPDSGERMMDITDEMVGFPSNIEVWESIDTRSLFIRQNRYIKSSSSDYTAEELLDVKQIAKSIMH